MIRTEVARKPSSIDAMAIGSARRGRAQTPHSARPKAPVARPERANPEAAPIERTESATEREFMLAMQEYKESSGRMFPTWSEVLEVLQNLGYRKPGAEDNAGLASPQ